MEHKEFMQQALYLAEEAAAEGEVPVGCVIVRNGEVVGRGRNRREKDKSALAHAEIEAIEEACRTLSGWRLWDCTLYVTLEPCPMCAGAIINARIPRVVFGASDKKCGACGSVCDLFSMEFNHHPTVETGVLEEDCKKRRFSMHVGFAETEKNAYCLFTDEGVYCYNDYKSRLFPYGNIKKISFSLDCLTIIGKEILKFVYTATYTFSRNAIFICKFFSFFFT